MATEVWQGYPPEINSGRWMAGTGPSTWLEAAAIWAQFAGLSMSAVMSIASEMATITGVTVTGIPSLKMMGVMGPQLAWWAGPALTTATINATACTVVAESWSVAEAGIVPLPEVNQNRITEAIAEATNFFGVNSGLIAELNMDYARMWAEDGTSMMTYDTAVTTVTMPKPLAPPPMLASAANTAAKGAELMAQSAANAPQAAAQAAQQGTQQATQAGSQASSGGADSMQQLLSPMMSAASSGPQRVSQPLQQLGQPLQQIGSQAFDMLSKFGESAGFGNGLDSAFAPAALSSPGGLPISSAAGAGGGLGAGGMGAGGGLMGPGNLTSLSGNNSKSVSVSPTGLSSGVPSPTIGSGDKTARMGGGMGPMGGMHGANQGGGGGGTRRVEEIVAAQVDYDDDAEIEQNRALFT